MRRQKKLGKNYLDQFDGEPGGYAETALSRLKRLIEENRAAPGSVKVTAEVLAMWKVVEQEAGQPLKLNALS